ncbi:hypothetical protein PQJ75_13520 [Rhodoplanes sp. TEM]|uniref:Phasin domain-containing protein n=1 Tax=Rhodoplanes tepidamans TaxID=200616 RepID=A0ABT5JDN1_RHOTP|nr:MULTISPECIES: hypothetical protein [Rhodoplanes]MDC7787369.1 hypothetical protein [Rhodoplanes tepidamans]MDC7984749.1 hypothetical protein [Rhodoplanes sp. TEM]MDQ0358280.1 hexokinase [Rhodoplanes tepidamans]
MSRKFESEYRVTGVAEVLKTENAFRQDVDLRLDRLEQRDSVIDTAAREVVDRSVRFVEQEIAPIAADLVALRDGIPVAIAQAQEQVDTFVAGAQQQVDGFIAAADQQVDSFVAAAGAQVAAFVTAAQHQVDELVAGGIDDGTF